MLAIENEIKRILYTYIFKKKKSYTSVIILLTLETMTTPAAKDITACKLPTHLQVKWSRFMK
jgi:hypothetical protein